MRLAYLARDLISPSERPCDRAHSSVAFFVDKKLNLGASFSLFKFLVSDPEKSSALRQKENYIRQTW